MADKKDKKKAKKSVGVKQKQTQKQKVIINIGSGKSKGRARKAAAAAPRPAPSITVTPQITIQAPPTAAPAAPKPITNFPGQGVLLGHRPLAAVPERGRAPVREVPVERLRAAAAEAYGTAMRRGTRLPAASSSPVGARREAKPSEAVSPSPRGRPVTPRLGSGGGGGAVSDPRESGGLVITGMRRQGDPPMVGIGLLRQAQERARREAEEGGLGHRSGNE